MTICPEHSVILFVPAPELTEPISPDCPFSIIFAPNVWTEIMLELSQKQAMKNLNKALGPKEVNDGPEIN